jgi:hypothetical protein
MKSCGCVAAGIDNQVGVFIGILVAILVICVIIVTVIVFM